MSAITIEAVLPADVATGRRGGHEGAGGGREMVKDGLFERFDCNEVYALHNWPMLPAGKVGVKPGPMMAATDTFDIRIKATGGHAAMPHNCVDPAVIAAQIVLALQSLVSRNTDPLDNAVVSVTQVHVGSAYNVIAEEAFLCGTVRTFNPAVSTMIEQGMARIVENTARAFGAEGTVSYLNGYPATVNHERQTEIAAAAAADVVGDDGIVRDIAPVMGGEDFSYMLLERPGAYVWVGQGGGPSACNVHNPRYDFNDQILPIGASFLARLVERQLAR